MSAGPSVIVAVMISLILIGIRFLVAWRLPADDEERPTPDDIAVYFRPFGHIEWGESAGLYGPWGPGHRSFHRDDGDSYP